MVEPEMTLEEQIARGLATAEGFVAASFADNYEPPQQLQGPRHALTDAGNSLRFTEDHEGELIYVKGPGWHVWDGKRWLRDDDVAVVAAKETGRRIRFEAAAQQDPDKRAKVVQHAFGSESKPRLEAMVSLASKGEIATAGLVVPLEKLDAQPHLLNCANGTVNLKTGKLLPHRKEHCLTHLVDIDYDPKATAPRWESFLQEVFCEDEDLIAYVQRAIGYSATGRNTEKCFFLAYGEDGDNGKSVFIETVSRVLGALSVPAAADTFVTVNQRSGNIPNDLASMRGARLVRVPETEDGAKLARQVIKNITGADTIKARFLYREWFDYLPQFKIWLVTNHLPTVPFTDKATWGRIRVIPFARRFAPDEQDQGLRDKLLKELPGILAWIVKGAYDWYKHGLGEMPLAVVEATFDYHASQDTLGRFLADETEDDIGGAVLRTELYGEYGRWCEAEKVAPVSARAFGKALEDRGYPKAELGVGRVFRGLRLSR